MGEKIWAIRNAQGSMLLNMVRKLCLLLWRGREEEICLDEASHSAQVREGGGQIFMDLGWAAEVPMKGGCGAPSEALYLLPSVACEHAE